MKSILAVSAVVASIMLVLPASPGKMQQPQAPPRRNFNFTGATLRSACDWEDKREKNELTILNNTQQNENLIGICQGFIMGVAMSDIDAGDMVITGPPTPATTLYAVVIEYMREHPEKLNQMVDKLAPMHS
jgi:hypothetical protein